MCGSTACQLKPVLDIYLTIEACSTIICNLHINPLWLFFRILIMIYVSVVFVFSVYYWYYDGKLKYMFAFYTNWVLLLQCLYFISSSYITYKIYREIQPKFRKTTSTKIRHHVSNQWDVMLNNVQQSNYLSANHPDQVESMTPSQDVMEKQVSYDLIGAPPPIKTLGLKKLFLLTKCLLEVSLSCSVYVCAGYWLTIRVNYDDVLEPIYYLNTHGIIFVIQLIECYSSTYQLRYISGTVGIIIFFGIAISWSILFTKLKLVNPFTNTNLLYSAMDWENEPKESGLIMGMSIVATIFIYQLMVYCKNLCLIKWKKSREAERKLSANDLDVDCDIDDSE